VMGSNEMRAFFTLYCRDSNAGKGEWRFEQDRDGIKVTDPDRRVVCWFPHKAANTCFDLPSFWRSIKHIVFRTDRGAVVEFEPDPKDVRIVRQYLDDALLAGGIEGLRRFRSTALVSAVGGLALVVVCLGVAYLLDQVFKVGKEFRRPLVFGAIAGIALTGWGVYSLLRYARLSRRAREEEEAYRPAAPSHEKK
jgi:hypothetical protein